MTDTPLITPAAPRAADAERWEQRFAQLTAFQTQHGHCRVTRAECAGDPGLFNWVVTQRQEQRRGRLLPEREARLTALGLQWSKERRIQFDFARFHAALTAHKAATGTPNIPFTCYQTRDPVYGEASLWLHYLRRGALAAQLTPTQRLLLAEMGVAFAPAGQRNRSRWETMLARFETLTADPQADIHAPEQTDLRHWVHVQRSYFKLGKMSQRRAERLRAVGFPLEDPSVTRSRHFQAYARLGLLARSNVPMVGSQLGHWVRSVRQRQAAGRLSAQDVAALEAIGFDWTPEALRDRVVRRLGLIYFLRGPELLLSPGKERLLVAFLDGVQAPGKLATQNRYLRQIKQTLERGLPPELLTSECPVEATLPSDHLARTDSPGALREALLRGGIRQRRDLAGLSLIDLAERCGIPAAQFRPHIAQLNALGVASLHPGDGR